MAFKDEILSRVRGKIEITQCSPVSSEEIGVYFIFNGQRKYSWITKSWRSGSDITHSIRGDKFNVSFTISDDGYHVKNLRVLK